MRKKKSVWKILYKIGVACIYIAIIAVLIMQALTPGNESSNISNSVGDKIDEVVTDIQKPEAERVNVSELTIDSLLVANETLSANDLTLSAGTKGKLKCTVSPSDASNKSLTYVSSNEDVVTVYADGTLEAKTAGAALITVTSKDNANVHNSITVKVTGVPLEDIKLTLSTTEFYLGKTYGLDVTYIPANTTEHELVFSSSDENVLTVNEKGEIVTVSEGSAIITATSKTNDELATSVTVTVTSEPEPEKTPVNKVTIKSVKVDGDSLSIKDFTISVGSTGKIQSSVSPSDASNKSLTYSSSDESVITVYSDGTIEAIKAGEALVTVTSQDDESISASITITVGEITVESIGISTKKTSLYVGQSYGLDVIYTPTNTTERDVTWSTSDKNVLTVNSSGKMKGIAAGTAIITATSKANAAVKASITVTVSVKPEVPEIPVTALSVTQNGGVGYVGDTEKLSCTVSPANATDTDVVWSSSDKSVATVNQSGKVTYVKAGSVTITARSSSYDVEDSVTITVKDILSQTITLDMEGLTEETDGSYTMKVATAAKIYANLDANATILCVDFSSSDPTIAKIGQDGGIEALVKGTVTITASTSYDGATTSTSFTLKIVGLTPDVESIELTHAEEYAYVGSTCTLSATFAPLNATDTLAWSSSDTKIATVTQGGTVTCRKAGTVTITAKCSSYNVEKSITITVKEVLSETITLDIVGFSKGENGGYTLKIATSGTIEANLDENATVREIVFASSDPTIAKIGQDGVIEGLAKGTVTITVSTSYDGETISESFELTVLGYSFSDTFENFAYWVRKSFGHFGAFFVLGIFAALTYHTLFPKSSKGKLLAFVVCLIAGFAIAGLTEICQLPIFTSGRYCSFDDVILDFQGYCCSAIPMFLLILFVHFIPKLTQRIRS